MCIVDHLANLSLEAKELEKIFELLTFRRQDAVVKYKVFFG
jgi:hypothetical protein